MVRTVLVAIVVDLSLVGFAGRDDSDGVMPWGIDHHEYALLDAPHQPVALFAVVARRVSAWIARAGSKNALAA